MSIFPSVSRERSKSGSPVSSQLFAQLTGIVLVTLGLLLFLSVVSFVPEDPILFSDGNPAIQKDQTIPENLIGIVGASLASLLFWIVGGAAYLVPFFFLIGGVRAMIGEGIQIRYQSVVGSILALLSLSALMQFRLSSVPILGESILAPGLAGGLGGQWIAQFLEPYFAYLGSHIVLVSGLLVSCLLISPTAAINTVRRVPQVLALSKSTTQALFRTRDADGEKVKPIKANKSIKINRSVPIRGGVGSFVSTSDEEKSPGGKKGKKGVAEDSKEDSVSHEDDMPMSVTGSVSKTYRLPTPVDLLNKASHRPSQQTDSILETQSQILTQSLLSFGIDGKVTEIHSGPVITMYEFAPGPGIKVARIVNLADDLAMALKALSVRVVAPLPGKSTVGIEVPNPSRETVALKDILTSEAFLKSRSKLALALGKDIFGRPVVADLRTMPHLLVAGATGAGKSVGLNCILLNILFTAHPDEVKLLLIDPKVLELQVYDGIPHLIRPVITNPKSAARGLTWAVQEMERRYRLLAEFGVRSIDAFNRKLAEQRDGMDVKENLQAVPQGSLPFDSAKGTNASSQDANGEEGARSSLSDEESLAPLPYIIVVIDEFADLMMVAPKDVEDRIARLAQMARASGIHLVLATQRPSVDVVTGLIKANFPARVAYQVSSKIDSRTILDANGAEALLGKGDMLYMASGTGRITRLHGPFVSDDEVRRVVEWVKRQAAPVYDEEALLYEPRTSSG